MMMKRSTLFRMLLAGAVCAVLLGAWRILLHDRAEPPGKAEASALEGLASQNRTRIEQLRSELQGARAAAPRPPELRDATGNHAGYSAELIAEVTRELKIVARARTMFNRDELIRAEMERAARDPKHVALVIDVASSWRLASELFGEDQAQARVYSLQVLHHLADTGDVKGVETAVDRIGAELNAEATWTKGIEHDYVDALAIYLRSIGLEKLIAAPELYYDRMHLSARTSVEVQKAFHDSGILTNASATALAEVRKMFSSYLGEEPPHG
jgi:hypothetical protein